MTDKIEDEGVENSLEIEDELETNHKIEHLGRASNQRKYQIRRQIEEAQEQRRFKELFEDLDE